MDTTSLITIIKRVPSLKAVPDNVIIAAAIIFTSIMVFFIVILVLSSIGTRKTEKKQEPPHDSHKLILELQKTLITEMKGTAKQNELMIRLTVIFISITLIGTIISLLGGQFFVDLIKRLIYTIGSIKIPGR